MGKIVKSQVLVSIIIPCYNAGIYLMEAVDSVTTYKGPFDIEIIIIDDGSTDEFTKEILGSLSGNERVRIIYQENKGPAAARNVGVRSSNGDYLLFLDSDNKIRDGYINIAVELLLKNLQVGVVHGKPSFFGESTVARFVPEEFNLCKILAKNYIDMCAMVRKQVWTEINGFDEDKLIIGHEDWDFWIRAHLAGWEFFFVREILFDYRILETSVVANANKPDQLKKTLQYLHLKHFDLYINCYHQLCQRWDAYQSDQRKPLRSLAKYSYRRLLKKPLY